LLTNLGNRFAVQKGAQISYLAEKIFFLLTAKRNAGDASC
jgi:hypothetical protein